MRRRDFLKVMAGAFGVAMVAPTALLGLDSAAGESVATVSSVMLCKEDWIRLDQAIIKAARYRLRAWSDLEKAGRSRQDYVEDLCFTVSMEIAR